MDIQPFLTFREVARSLNITRSAERLRFAQPTVSVHIRKLESHYGAKLFERKGRGLQLTASGVKLLEYADRMAEAYEEADQSLRAAEAKLLHIGTVETLAAFFLPPVFQHFRQHYPQVNLALQPSTESEIARRVKQGELDAGIILDPPFADGELRTIAIRREELAVICRPDDPLSAKAELTLGDLSGANLILTEQGCTYRAALEGALKEERVPYQIVSELGSIEAVKQCVRFGMGVALIPHITVAGELASGILAASRFREGIFPDFYIQIILRKNRLPSPALQHLTDLLKKEAAIG